MTKEPESMKQAQSDWELVKTAVIHAEGVLGRAEVLAAVERLEAERQGDTEILDWLEDNPGVALKYGLGGKAWRAMDTLEKGYQRSIVAVGKTLRETVRAAIESTKEPANG